MHKARLEAFSDAVIAIIITIMVLEFKVPEAATMQAFSPLVPKLLSYLLSFIIVAIMWVNHHHIMHSVEKVDNRLLWTNNLMLFWMSLIPFVTAFVGDHFQAPLPVALYGVDMVFCGMSFTFFRLSAVALYVPEARRPRLHWKDMVASGLYFIAIPLAYVSVWISFAIFAVVALSYFAPRAQATK